MLCTTLTTAAPPASRAADTKHCSWPGFANCVVMMMTMYSGPPLRDEPRRISMQQSVPVGWLLWYLHTSEQHSMRLAACTQCSVMDHAASGSQRRVTQSRARVKRAML